MSNLKCISWSAVSSRPQVDGESLTDQSNKNKQLIASLNGQCVADLVVPGESREILDLDTASAKIPAYAQLSAIIRNRDADLLVCQDLSRLGREASLIIQIVRLCQRNQIALYARSSPPSTLDARKQETDIAASLMLALESAMVRVEMINLRKRHDIGTRGRAKRGLFANKIPYGYLRKYRAAYSKGIITEDDLETALHNLQYARLDLQSRITDLENQIAGAEHRSASVARLHTVADVGLQMLRGDKASANQWLSKYLRIWIEDNKVLLFQYL